MLYRDHALILKFAISAHLSFTKLFLCKIISLSCLFNRFPHFVFLVCFLYFFSKASLFGVPILPKNSSCISSNDFNFRSSILLSFLLFLVIKVDFLQFFSFCYFFWRSFWVFFIIPCVATISVSDSVSQKANKRYAIFDTTFEIPIYHLSFPIFE